MTHDLHTRRIDGNIKTTTIHGRMETLALFCQQFTIYNRYADVYLGENVLIVGAMLMTIKDHNAQKARRLEHGFVWFIVTLVVLVNLLVIVPSASAAECTNADTAACEDLIRRRSDL